MPTPSTPHNQSRAGPPTMASKSSTKAGKLPPEARSWPTGCSRDGNDIGGVKVTCFLDGGKTEEIGFLNIFDGKVMTVGWNCEMSSAELRVPRIAMGLVKSQTDDDRVARERRGLKEFSIMAQNGVGDEMFGFSVQ